MAPDVSSQPSASFSLPVCHLLSLPLWTLTSEAISPNKLVKCSVLNHSNRVVAKVFHKKCPSQMQSLERLVVSGDAQALLVEVCHWEQDLSAHSLALLQFPCHWNVPAALPHCRDEFLPLQNHKRKQNFHNESCFGSWSLYVATESN